MNSPINISNSAIAYTEANEDRPVVVELSFITNKNTVLDLHGAACLADYRQLHKKCKFIPFFDGTSSYSLNCLRLDFTKKVELVSNVIRNSKEMIGLIDKPISVILPSNSSKEVLSFLYGFFNNVIIYLED